MDLQAAQQKLNEAHAIRDRASKAADVLERAAQAKEKADQRVADAERDVALALESEKERIEREKAQAELAKVRAELTELENTLGGDFTRHFRDDVRELLALALAADKIKVRAIERCHRHANLRQKANELAARLGQKSARVTSYGIEDVQRQVDRMLQDEREKAGMHRSATAWPRMR